MFTGFTKRRHSFTSRAFSVFLVVSFLFNSVLLPNGLAQILPRTTLALPAPGTMVSISPVFAPAMLKGIKIFPDNPLRFDFIIDTGDSGLDVGNGRDRSLQKESEKLIKYFLTSLTVPEEELWVNLSPYEKDRIIPEAFGVTEMGRDLLAQDYLLKQLTASLMYPEEELGKTFWEKIYKLARKKYETTEIPVNTFNKVWIVPEKAVVYENGDTAFVVESHLKVMLEEDYEAMHLQRTEDRKQSSEKKELSSVDSPLSSEIIREIILPTIEREVNEGKHFAQLRQIYHSLILAAWFKRNLHESILGKIYVNQNKIDGVDIDDQQAKQKIYEQYLEAFKTGVYNYIKEDYDPVTQEIIPRKYFSGGMELKMTGFGGMGSDSSPVLTTTKKFPQEANHPKGQFIQPSVQLDPQYKDIPKAASPGRALKENLLAWILAVGIACTGAGCGGGSTADHLPEDTSGGTEISDTIPDQEQERFVWEDQYAASRFVPPRGKVLLSVGAQLSVIEDYIAATGIVPAGFMTYTSIQDMDGLYDPVDKGAGIHHAQYYVDKYPHTILQIGLYMVDALDDVLSGGYDANIAKLGEWIKQSGRPVYLRIGYEFDAPSNRYDPAKYQAAYRYVVDYLNKMGVTNAAYVWHSGVYPGQAGAFEAAYPGDDYVDWAGISYFSPEQIPMAKRFAEFAAAHHKPLMIAEASPHGLPSIEEKKVWMQGLFEFILENNVKFLSWINSHWDALPQFANDHLGDARVEQDPELLRLWLQEIQREKYLQSSGRLDESLRFPPAASPVGEMDEDGSEKMGEGRPAMAATDATKGGIDLNPANLDIETRGVGTGFKPVSAYDWHPVETMPITGFTPIIIQIVPVTNLPFLLGFAPDKIEETAQEDEKPRELSFRATIDPLDLRRRFGNEVSSGIRLLN